LSPARARAASLAALLLALAAPAAAWACPSCATRDGPGAKILALVGVMIAVPYAVAVVAIRVVRRIVRDSDQEAGS
jgi:hypothetical protein